MQQGFVAQRVTGAQQPDCVANAKGMDEQTQQGVPIVVGIIADSTGALISDGMGGVTSFPLSGLGVFRSASES